MEGTTPHRAMGLRYGAAAVNTGQMGVTVKCVYF